MDLISKLFSNEGFIPRALCGAWTPGMIWLHNMSDFFIWTAYIAIPIVLFRFAYSRRRDLPFRAVFGLFGIFILACGTTHLLDIVMFYNPLYYLSGMVKLITAAASWGTVIALWFIVPQALKMRSLEDMEREIEQRQLMQTELKSAHDQLESRVAERTAELRASEDSFRLLTEVMPQIVWTARPDGFLDYYNRKWIEYTGMSVEETQGWGWQPVLHPDDVQPCLDAWAHSVQSGEDYEIEYRFKRAADGAYRWHLGRALPLRDEAGNITKWFGTGTDIDDQKRAQQELQRSHEELEQLVQERTSDVVQSNAAFEVANAALGYANITLQSEIAGRERVENNLTRFFDLSLDMVCVAGFDGFFKRLNPAWESSLGYSCEELMARPFLDFVHPDDLLKTGSEQEQNNSGQDTESFENRYRCKDGSYKWLEWRARTVPEEQTIYATARDITKSKKAEQDLQATMLQLERSNNDLQHFASIASHDLQEPLRAIQAFGDRLQTKHGDVLNEEAHDYLTRMQNAASRMRALIQDLLAYSRVTTKTRPFSSVDLAETTGAILSDLTMRLEETEGRVEIGELPTIDADAMQMRQLFQNLIDNGLKFHRENEPPVVRVYVQQEKPNDSEAEREIARIVVEDNGIGFDEKFSDRIFSPFERLHNQRKYSGTGIGLAICRKIAERHGGGISVQSTPGQGSRFLISLPLRQSETAWENPPESGEEASPH